MHTVAIRPRNACGHGTTQLVLAGSMSLRFFRLRRTHRGDVVRFESFEFPLGVFNERTAEIVRQQGAIGGFGAFGTAKLTFALGR